VKEDVPPAAKVSGALKEAVHDTTIMTNLVENCGAGKGLTISQIRVADPAGIFQILTQNPTPPPTKAPVKIEPVCEAIGSNRRQCYRQGRECTWDRTRTNCVNKQRSNRRRKKRANLFSGINNI